jgi:GTP-binding protein
MSATQTSIDKLRNIAIIAHVDHGITILAKNTAINWNDYRINIVDTPGHADFGGEVERVMSMADSVLLLVDAQEGPMPQTRFVTQKAFAQGLKPIVVINKIDKPGARPDWVIDQVFDLFDNLGATDDQLDFQVVYASAINGWATNDVDVPSEDMTPLFETIVGKVAPPDADQAGAFQMQISQLDYNSYVGVIGVGRITRGTVKINQQVTIVNAEGEKRNGKVGKVLGYLGLDRHDVDSAAAGDIIAITGLGELKISDTICDVNQVEALPALSVDEPTVTMTFQVNTSPFAGKEGKFVTSRNILERLQNELVHNVALRVEEMPDPDKFRVSGRGELHLGILIENMRREGYELAVSRPEVILKEVDGVLMEPFETMTVDVEEQHQGSIIEQLGLRKAEMTNMSPDGKGRTRVDFVVPSRGLIGFQTDFMTLTSGSGLLYHTFDHYGPHKGGNIGTRKNGVLIANATGKALTNAIFNLQERGRMFIGHGVEVYEGMVLGIHSRENDLTVNALKGKQLTNVRASGTDEAQTLVPPIVYTLEQALEFIDDDELVEVTPVSIRIRKKLLTENERKRAGRAPKS